MMKSDGIVLNGDFFNILAMDTSGEEVKKGQK
jgi:hypothetical protein